jgi:hypothetical protein
LPSAASPRIRATIMRIERRFEFVSARLPGSAMKRF